MQITQNKTRAERVIQFIETLTIPEGKHEGKPFILRPWQKGIIYRIYAPMWADGFRVVRKAIYSVAKKNGKTPLVAAIILCHLIGPESKRNEQIYSAAYEKEQAGLTFEYMSKMIEYDQELTDITNVLATKKQIKGLLTGSKYSALSAEAKSKHGISPALLIFDELAQFEADRRYYDALIQGFGAHAEPLMLIISTQAENDQAILSEEIDYALGEGKDDPTVELFLFTTPEKDSDGNIYELTNMEAAKLSNPALGDFLDSRDFMGLAKMAIYMPSSEPGFRNLRLNQRVAATSRFMALGIWNDNSALPSLDALSKGRITAGLDLSGKNDLSSLVLDAFWEKEHHLFAYFWKPGDMIMAHKKKDRVPYDTWVKQGLIEATPGKVIDYEYIALKVQELHVLHHISELRFDRWRIEDFQKALDKVGCESHIKGKEEPESDESLCLVPHGQGYKDMNPAIESVEDIFTESRARHGGNAVLTMCVSNTVVEKDPAGNRKFEKHKSTGRIDGTVAMAMSMNGAELPDTEDNKSQPMPVFL